MSMNIDKIMNGGSQYAGKKVDGTRANRNSAGKTDAKQGIASQMTVVKNRTNTIKQPELSEKAQNLLEKLKKTYGGKMDFMIYGENDDPKELLQYATKEYTVLFSSEELEKMAEDENYEKEAMDKVLKAVDELSGIAEKTGINSEDGNNGNGQITRIGISFNEDGTLKLFADLEKSTAQQQERMEKLRNKRAEEKRAAEKREAKKAGEAGKDKIDENDDEKLIEKKMNDYYSKYRAVKRLTVEADSVEELIEKINGVNWDNVSEDIKPTGKMLNMKA